MFVEDLSMNSSLFLGKSRKPASDKGYSPNLDTVHLFVTVYRTVCNPVYSLRLCHKGVVWRGELGSPPSIQKVIWIHYDFQIEFELEFIF